MPVLAPPVKGDSTMLRAVRACSLLVASIVMTAGASRAQTVDELVAKNLEAKGGIEKLKAVNSVRTTAKIQAQGTETLMTLWARRPNMFRREMQSQGNTVIISFDGNTVWTINPLSGSNAPQEVTGMLATMTREQADFDGPLVDYKQRGFTVELVGKENLKDKPVHHLRITSKSGQVQHYYLDADSGLEVKTSTTMDQGGMKMELSSEMSNYQKVNGFAVPFSLQQSMNGAVAAQITLEKIEFNVPTELSMFRMPAQKK
jgi:outer membrane lipoprotein-sorting protein